MAESGKPLASEVVAHIVDMLIRETGMVYFADRHRLVAGTVRERMRVLKLDSAQGYFHHLTKSPTSGEEWDMLVASLTVGETHFFRHREQLYRIVDTVLPDCLAQPRARWIIWCAGCSSGAEPYSLSYLIKTTHDSSLARSVEIVGTDINKVGLQRAREGLFREWELRSVTDEERHRVFERVHGHWRIRPEFRRGVRFECHNLVTDAIPSPNLGLTDLDAIVCRNVLIYFGEEESRGLLNRFTQALRPGGWLIAGPSDPAELLRDAFEPTRCGGTQLYRKPEPVPRPRPVLPRAPAPPARPPDRSFLGKAQNPGPKIPREPVEEKGLADLKTLIDRGQWKEAEALVAALHSRFGMDAVFHLYCGLVEEQRDGAESALTALRRALYLDSSLIAAQYHRARLAYALGDGKRLRRALRAAFQCLGRQDSDRSLPHCDGLTATELRRALRLMNNEEVGSGR